nr:hypothetical protein L203_03762 [Cryptococcus depauperatus CBS 7841]
MSTAHQHIPSLAITDEETARLQKLYAKFQDPTSHYHLPPGTGGPGHEQDHASNRMPEISKTVASNSTTTHLLSASTGPTELSNTSAMSGSFEGRSEEEALKYFEQHGHDTVGLLKWPVAWGDQDTFQHVNNVQIVRWCESARIRYIDSWASVLGEEAISGILRAKGTGVILKEINVKYKAPITFPDTIIVSNQIHAVNPERASYGHRHLIWSLKDRQVKAIGDGQVVKVFFDTIVMYDYDNLRKGVMSDKLKALLENLASGKR